MNSRLKILVTNDDGIQAKGINLLVSNLLETNLADVYVVAPKEEQSGKSMSFSYTSPVVLEEVEYPLNVSGSWTVSGSPVDCVKVALGYLFKDSLPDLVLSGINHGSNAGRNIFYSGTVGAAMEAIISGVPSIAFSQEKHISFFQEKNAPELLKKFILYAIATPFPIPAGFNVTFPACEREEDWKGLKLVASGKEFAFGSPQLLSAEGKCKAFSLSECQTMVDADASEEFKALSDNYISIAPLLMRNSPLGLLSGEEFQKLQEQFQEFIHSDSIPELK